MPLSRRCLITHGTLAVASLGRVGASSANEGTMPTPPAATPLNRRIHQSVSRWCYEKIPLDRLCQAAAAMGLVGIDLLHPEEYAIPSRYGLRCTMGYAGGGEIDKGLNRTENHAAIEAGLRVNVPPAAKAGVPNVITFSGLRAPDLDDEQGARNTIAGLKRLAPIVEDHGVTLCLELLNSKRDHPHYMADHVAWGVRVCQEAGSPRVRLLNDLYHMQIMEGDLIATIEENHAWFAHYHTGGVPGRHELDPTQEVQWAAVMRAIAATGYAGYVAHEFVPTRDPVTSLTEAVRLCDVS